MEDFFVAFMAKFYAFFFIMDVKLCNFWMKVTGHGRRSYFAVMATLVVGSTCIVTSGEDYSRGDLVWSGILVALYGLITYMYFRWLKNKNEGLSTVKVSGIWYNTTAIESFAIVVLIRIFIQVFTIGWALRDPVQYCLAFLVGLGMIFFFCARSHSGPPQPDNTYWQQAKSKAKSFIESQRRPALVPLPIRV